MSQSFGSFASTGSLNVYFSTDGTVTSVEQFYINGALRGPAAKANLPLAAKGQLANNYAEQLAEFVKAQSLIRTKRNGYYSYTKPVAPAVQSSPAATIDQDAVNLKALYVQLQRELHSLQMEVAQLEGENKALKADLSKAKAERNEAQAQSNALLLENAALLNAAKAKRASKVAPPVVVLDTDALA